MTPEPERSGSPITDFWRDARYGARLLVRNPGFTVTLVTTLAFGIAANTMLQSEAPDELRAHYAEAERAVLGGNALRVYRGLG